MSFPTWNDAVGWNGDWFPLPGQAVFDREILCCTEACRQLEASASGVLNDPGIARASQFEHSVEGGRRDGDLGRLGFVAARSQRCANHAFVSAD